jgi:hypothetical protein
MPAATPRVKWEVTSTTTDTVGGVPMVTKQLVGHVDNSAYPVVSVDIQLTLATPASARGPVPVIMEFGFGPRPRAANAPAPPAPPAPPPEGTWQEQLARKGWGYAVLVPTSVQADNGAGLTRGIIGLVNKGQPRDLDDWGALRAWAWGASRALDYFETDGAVDVLGNFRDDEARLRTVNDREHSVTAIQKFLRESGIDRFVRRKPPAADHPEERGAVLFFGGEDI